ncbi:xylulokinase [Buchananella hordeovulneris]|uniref:Xylulose kinase n=1 Tax=Buchananella hordeovulneris TaxID=52770 RepID=A0A1Q5PWJ4_9ACTO|nr:xylulokinase [Buchananella hordeovulneris]OKL51993.1 xylulokinase [Buchananella hordeovulneris]
MSSKVAGVDTSTQSCKVIVWDPQTGQVVREGTAPHPEGTEVDPQAWWEAFCVAAQAAGGLDDVAALSVAGQQHGLVLLDADGAVIRPALLWNDTRSAQAASELVAELGADTWIQATGSVPVASLTVAKLRWIATHEPEALARTAAICLPHDWLSWRLLGSQQLTDLYTDRSDASGTGYLDVHTATYRHDLLAHALGSSPTAVTALQLPRVVAPAAVAGQVARAVPEIGLRAGTLLGPGCGDNAGAALGLDLQPGQASVSLGTSGVVAVVSREPVLDPHGVVTGFMDATGHYLPLACTLNGARVMSATAALLGVNLAEFDELALSVPDTGGLQLTPYFEGERTPNLPDATASLTGMTLQNWRPAPLARAAVQGLCDLLAGAAAAIQACGVELDRVKLVGGGANSPAVRALLPAALGVPVDVPAPGQYVALGAAKQAAAVLHHH